MMVQKISLKGYNSTSPFKLFYLCCEEGVDLLAESFVALLVLRIGDKKTKDLVSSWALSSYPSDRTALGTWTPVEKAEFEATKKKVESILEEVAALVVPLRPQKTGELLSDSMFNRRSQIIRSIRSMESSIVNSHGIPWARSTLEWNRRSIRELGGWAGKSPRLLVEGELLRSPCSMCVRAPENLEGECGFGGQYCVNSLNKSLKGDSHEEN